MQCIKNKEKKLKKTEKTLKKGRYKEWNRKPQEEKTMRQQMKKSEERPKNLQLQKTIGPSRCVVNFAQESEKTREKVFKILEKANEKRWGKEITFKDVTSYALSLLTEKDVKRLQESSLGDMDKVQRCLADYNKKTGEGLVLGKFLVRKLKI